MNIVTIILIPIILGFLVGMFIKTSIEMNIMSNNKWYCKYYCKDDWNRWKYIQDHIDNIKLIKIDYDNDSATLMCYFKFKVDDVNQKLFEDKEYYITFHYNTGLCYVLSKNECILSTFDEYNSKKTAMLLCDMLKKEYHIKNIAHSLLKKVLVKETNKLQEYYQDIADIKQIISSEIKILNRNQSIIEELLVDNDSLDDKQKERLEYLTKTQNELKDSIVESNTILVKFRKLVKDTEKKIQHLKCVMKQKQRSFKTK